MTKAFSDSNETICFECEGVTLTTDSYEQINIYPDTDGSIEVKPFVVSYELQKKLSDVPVYPNYLELVNPENKAKSKIYRTYADLDSGIYVELLMGSQIETKDGKEITTFKVLYSFIKDWDSQYPIETLYGI